MKEALYKLLILLSSLSVWASIAVQPVFATDLPGPNSNMETIPAGSLLIPMDNDKQNLASTFNLKAYGLVNSLLWDEIPVKWAIRAGKTKDGIDISAQAQRIFPSPLAPATLNFRAGPFIIHRDWADFAKTKITAFGSQVAIYELTEDVNVDVRYTLTQKRKVAVLDDGGNAGIHKAVLAAAGFVEAAHYDEIPAATLLTINANSCYTIATEPHFDANPADEQVQAIRGFVESGGNFLAQCVALLTYENNLTYGHFQTTNGIVENNLGNTSFLYNNPDLAFSQFQGNLADEGGSVQDFELAAGSSFQNSGHLHVHNTPLTDRYVATASKLTAGTGSMVFYLGAHEYSGTSLGQLNGQRMYLNAILMPSGRPTSCGLDFQDDPATLRSISGNVYEDIDGDSNLSGAVGVSNVPVRLYGDDNDNGLVDGGDAYITETTTDTSGSYSFGVNSTATGVKYLAAVDSKSITPSVGLNGGFSQGNVWAQQTYGDNATIPTLDLAARYGGQSPGVSDDFNPTSTVPANNSYQHLARIDVTSGNLSAVDFGFSFNVVTNVRGGDNGDDDGSAARTIQGSLRQFLQNANAINGANVMRLVPAVAANGSGGGGQWWRVSVSVDLPDVLDTNTTIDGTAYSLSNGTTLRDDNPGSLGTGGVVGVDGLALPTLGRPEFEIVDINNRNIGLDLQANNSTIRSLAIYGFGDAQGNDGEANIRVGEVSGALIAACVVGASASSFTSTGEIDTGDNIRVPKGDSGTIRNNLIGFSGGSGIGFKDSANGWTIEGNEIRGNALEKMELNGISLEKCNSATIRGNLIVDNEGAGVDTKDSTGSNTIENNTISANGIGTVETPGIRLYGTGSTIERNVIYENYGAGVMVTKDATQNTISQNSIYDNGTASNQIGIDLLEGGDDDKTGDAPFVTLNDPGDTDGDANGLLNFPVLETADISGSDLTLTGFARPGSVIEFFIAEPDPSGFGEGKTYLLTLTEGSAADLDTTTGSYGPGPVNGISQGEDTTNRFQFEVSVPPGVNNGTQLTATATLGSSTSELSGNVAVTGFLLANLTLVKSASAPTANPTDVLTYTVIVINSGAGEGTNVVVDDKLSPYVVWSLDSFGAGVPFEFIDGSSGLTIGTPVYSNNNGLDFNYTPVSEGDGAPAGYDGNVTNWQIPMTGTMNASGQFTLRYKVMVQ